MTMWLTTPDVIAELDRRIVEELRKQMVREGRIVADLPTKPEKGSEQR